MSIQNVNEKQVSSCKLYFAFFNLFTFIEEHFNKIKELFIFKHFILTPKIFHDMKQEEPKDGIKKEKKRKVARTASTMFRNAMANHLQLSALADRKAGLLVSINSIIISIMTSFLVHEFATNPKLLLPASALLIVCLLTITYALLSTLPNVKPTNHDNEMNTLAKTDLLFFGDYTQLSVHDYKSAMNDILLNDAVLHDKMIENIYAQGKVIQRKYRLLRTAYLIFMIGFPIAIIVFFLFLYHYHWIVK